MIINIRKFATDAHLPTRGSRSAAGWDLYAHTVNFCDDFVEIGCGVAVKIPEGWCGLLFPRSSVSNTDFMLANSVGLIDSDYTGELKLRFKPLSHELYGVESPYSLGDRCGQIVFQRVPDVEWNEVDMLEETERGNGGFGSSGGFGGIW